MSQATGAQAAGSQTTGSQAAGLDLGLYLVTDPDLTGERSLFDVVAEAVAGGVGLVQLRDKGAEARDLLALAQELNVLLAPKGVPLVVNDRVDVAAAAGVGSGRLSR